MRTKVAPCLFLILVQIVNLDKHPVATSLVFSQEIESVSPNNLVPEHSALSIVAVGDVMLGSWVAPIIEKHGTLYPFAKTLDHIKAGDVAIANLEAPFTDGGKPFEKQFNFKVPPKYASGLRGAGFDVVTLANNHIMDYGEYGLESTMHALKNANIEHCGAGMNLEEAHKPTVMLTPAGKVGFWGYSMTFPKEFYAKSDSSGTAYPEPELMAANLRAWEDSVDFSIVSFHWGAEKADTPKDYQIFFAHLAIDSGADLVLGHHPHVLQGLEVYKNRLIAYSLGNFAFGSYSKYATESIILKVYLNREGLLLASCVPINVDNRLVDFQPHLFEGDKRMSVIRHLQKLSRPLNGDREIVQDSGFILGDWRQFYHEWLTDQLLRSFWPILSHAAFIDSSQTVQVDPQP